MIYVPAKDTLELIVRATVNAANRALETTRSRFSQLRKSISNSQEALNKYVGGMAQMRMGISIINGLITPAKDFATTMANVSTMVDDTAGTMDFFRESILDMTKTIPQTADQLGAGLYQVLSAGISDSADAMMVLEISAKAATAGLSTTEVAVDAITTVINAYGFEAQSASKISDIMFTTVKRGKTTFEALATGVGRVATVAATAGVDIENLFSAVASLTKAGLTTDEAITALRQTMLAYIKPTDQAKDAAKAIGLELSANALQSRGLAGAMQDLAIASENDSEVLAEMFPNVRALVGTLGLARGQAVSFNEDLVAMQSATEGAGAATVAFDKINNTSASDLQRYENQVMAVKIAMGDNFLPVLLDTLGPMTKMLEVYQDLPEPIQKTIPALIALAGATMILGAAMMFLNTATIKWTAIAAALITTFIFLNEHGSTLEAMMGTLAVALVGLGIAALFVNSVPLVATIVAILGAIILLTPYIIKLTKALFGSGLHQALMEVGKAAIFIISPLMLIITHLDKIIGLAGRAGDSLKKIPGIGALGKVAGATGGLLSFKRGTDTTGGTIPGPVGRPVPIIAHGGERIDTAEQATTGGDNITINVYGPRELEREVIRITEKHFRRGVLAR